ncbi:hypothetical protein C4578_02455 [Candidatus Microgenomates bacterium]|jgi:hypothetical protein|nr:MAG: hypothetical protein C4578_02455 [Candidatus Microgenomates bacterium]
MVEKSSKVQKYILFLLIFLIIVLISFNFILDRKDLREKITGVFEPKPGSCLILEEKYCKEVKIIPHPTEENIFIAAANLPVGTLIFSPIDGYYSDSTNSYKNEDGTKSRYPGFIIMISEDGTFSKTEGVHGFVVFSDETFKNSVVKKGDKLGRVSDKKIDRVGDYNLIYSITKYERNEDEINIQFVNDYDSLKAMFSAN